MLRTLQLNTFVLLAGFLNVLVSSSTFAQIYRPGPDTSLGALPGSGSVTNLQAAISSANATLVDDIIDLGGLVYTITGSNTTYSTPDAGTVGLPVITPVGTGGRLSIINGTIRRSTAEDTPNFGFIYNQGGNLTLVNIRMYNALLSNGFGNDPHGGAVHNNSDATLYIEDCIFSVNAAFFPTGIATGNGRGGAIYNSGVIERIQNTIINSGSFSANANFGGGIYNRGLIEVIDATSISANFAKTSGGGIYNASGGEIALISNTTISYNGNDSEVGMGGGGIHNEALINSIINTTIYSNHVLGAGGGIRNIGTINAINNSTISENTGSFNGGGMCNTGTINQMFSNIFASNNPTLNGDVECTGTWPIAGNEGYNLIGVYAGNFSPNETDIIGTSANLGPLQNYGGPTETAAILLPNEAVNAGFNPNALIFDQRGTGFPRIACGAPDIGAYELQSCINE